jgi:hypothetical protein
MCDMLFCENDAIAQVEVSDGGYALVSSKRVCLECLEKIKRDFLYWTGKTLSIPGSGETSVYKRGRWATAAWNIAYIAPVYRGGYG